MSKGHKEGMNVMYVPGKENYNDGEIWTRIPVKGFDPGVMDLTDYCCSNDSGTWNTTSCTVKSGTCPSDKPMTVAM